MFSVTVSQSGLPQMAAFTHGLSDALNDSLWLNQQVGEAVAQNIREIDFPSGGNPLQQWEPTWPDMADAEGKGHNRPLIWKGELAGSIKAVADMTGVDVGSPLAYARHMLRGRRSGGPHDSGYASRLLSMFGKRAESVNVWPRPYLGIYERDVQDIIARLQVRIGRRP